ncbi:MAG: rhomboid family intramembrane serine protease [Chitinophaga sp.]|uniref:rhomboid family intramembrane serine protease n=1 Tax=Chitinophaga sp. TaxID=1869181 RepID=UPI0025BB18A1|nr:rhomboid family intramembrane serine protease [Chitinophaga sp.]MBV8254843.1 rhomboid family intramembrane serine protease [Chitinophaga sp.]
MSTSTYQKKFQLIILPVLLTGLAFILGYSFLRWLLDIRLRVLPLKHDVITTVLPILLAVTLVLLFRPRFKTIQFKDKSSLWLMFVAALMCLIPTLLFQQYLENISYQEIQVKFPGQINSKQYNRNYNVGTYVPDLSHVGVYHMTYTSGGRYESTLNFSTYITFPLYDKPSDTAGTPQVWYCLQYMTSTSNESSDSINEMAFRKHKALAPAFLQREFSQMGHTFEREPTSEYADYYLRAIKKKYPDLHGTPILLKPATTHSSSSESLMWISLSFGIGAAIFIWIVLAKPFDEKALNQYLSGKPFSQDMLGQILHFLNPKGEYPGSAIMININLAIYLIMILMGVPISSAPASTLLDYGAMYYPYVMDGQYWRIFTAIFIHSNGLHILYNMMALGIAGVMLEKLIGPKKFILFYLITGVIAAVVSMFWDKSSIQMGASGAIFGLFGVIAGMLLRKAIPKDTRAPYWVILIAFVGLSLLLGLVMPNVGNAAHISGLIAGVLLGLLPYKALQTK